MNYKYIFNLLIAVVLFASCDRDELLDIKPYGVDIPSTLEDYRLLMDQRSAVGAWDRSVGRVPTYEIDLLMSDDIKVPNQENHQRFIGWNGEQIIFNAVTWEEHFADTNEDDPTYNTLYNHILISNIVIENLSGDEITGDEALRQKLIAEAKVHRAVAYFALVNLYSKQYDASSATNDLGVSIKTAIAVQNTPRSSVQEVYDLILNDLNEALNANAMEESVPDQNWRASNVSAYAFLARVYLQMGDYENALAAAENALSTYNYLYDYNDNFWSLPRSYDNLEVILEKGVNGFTYNTQVNPSDELMALYDASDLRTNIRFADDWETGGKVFLPFYRAVDVITTGPSVPEMYMIRAECNARLGSGDPIADLNTIRENRYATGSYVALTSADLPNNDAILAFVKDERRRELVNSGVRWFDLKRYNTLDNAGISITRNIEGVGVTVLEPNSNRWIMPIARSVISIAPEIEQSPR